MKWLIFATLLIAFLIFTNGCGRITDKHLTDERLSENLDTMLGDMVSNCKDESLRNLRLLYSDDDIDTSCYYMTLNLYTKNDTVKIEAMGEYNYPIICHDSLNWGMGHFIGHFKRENVNWLLYECLYNDLPNRKIEQPCPQLVSIFHKNWKIQKNPIEHPEFFQRDISETIRDPYIFEYMIDSIGKISLLRKGRW